jgi:excisionase family DNA binding protein
MKFTKPIVSHDPTTATTVHRAHVPDAAKSFAAKDAAHLVKIEEIARLLNVSERQVQKMMRDRAIPFVVLGRRCVRLDPRDVVAFVKKQYGIQALNCNATSP